MEAFTIVVDRLIKVVDVLVWPITLIILVYWFRSEFASILSRLSNLKYKDLEASFESELKKAEAEVESIRNVEDGDKKYTEPDIDGVEVGERLRYYIDMDQYIEVATVSPRASILMAWPAVEKAMREAASRTGVEVEGIVSPHQIMNQLREGEYISQEIFSSFNRLRKLRNEAAHIADLDITSDEAERYILILIRILGYLEMVGRK